MHQQTKRVNGDGGSSHRPYECAAGLPVKTLTKRNSIDASLTEQWRTGGRSIHRPSIGSDSEFRSDSTMRPRTFFLIGTQAQISLAHNSGIQFRICIPRTYCHYAPLKSILCLIPGHQSGNGLNSCKSNRITTRRLRSCVDNEVIGQLSSLQSRKLFGSQATKQASRVKI